MEFMVVGLTVLLIIVYCLNKADKEIQQSLKSKN